MSSVPPRPYRAAMRLQHSLQSQKSSELLQDLMSTVKTTHVILSSRFESPGDLSRLREYLKMRGR